MLNLQLKKTKKVVGWTERAENGFDLGLKTKKNEDKTKCSTFFLNSKTEKVIHNSDIYNVQELMYNTIMTKIQRYQSAGWTLDWVIKQNINNSKYKHLSGSSYTKLLKELNHSRIDLSSIENTDDN